MRLSGCPICESKKMKIVKGEVRFQTHKGEIVVPDVTRQKCLACGEEFFDHQANLVLDAYRRKNKAVAIASY